MRPALALTLLLVGSTLAQAGEKVHALSSGNLKITGEVAANDPKVKVTHPEANVTVELPAKVYKVKLEAGKYQIDITSDAIDPVLVIQDKTGKQLAFDDDGGEGLNSRLQFQAAKDDVYTIVAASLKGAGDYTLTVKQTGVGAGEPGLVGGKGMALKDGKLTVNGQVAANDPKVNIKVPDVNQTVPLPAKSYEVNLPAGKYQIDIMSTDIDPVLVIQDKTGKQLALDDDGGEGLNSRLEFQAAAAGTYKIFAASLKGAGAFTLTIKSLGGGGKADGKADGKVLDIGAGGLKVNGALSRDTKTITYQVRLEAGKDYVITMTSADQKKLDPFIEVRGANGTKLAEDDDGAGDLNSRLVFNAKEGGVYQIVARSFAGIGMGDFTLEVRRQD